MVLISYLSGFIVACTSNWSNVGQCIRVWDYIPAYYWDYVEFKTYGPYYQERAVKK